MNATPSHMNAETSRIVLLFDDKSKDFWTRVNESFDKSINEEKFHGFYHAKGTALFFVDMNEIWDQEMNMSSYRDYFETWGHHSAAMLQLNLWQALRDEEIGASIQHYNPVIDEWVKEVYDLPEYWELVAQMPFGKIGEELEARDKKASEEKLLVIE